MPKEIREIFVPEAKSTREFLIVNGQGCYIPPYQRPYSWDSKDILRLFEDVLNGIHQISHYSDTVSFIGTIIAIHDSEYHTVNPIYHSDVAPRVMTIIDGQQRISTIVMANIVLHEYIHATSKRFNKKTDSHLVWINDQCIQMLSQLRNTYLIDQYTGDSNYRYYPRIIRSYKDVWSRKQNLAKYESPIAKLIWNYINFTQTESKGKFNSDLGQHNHYKSVNNAFRLIQKEIRRICNLRTTKKDSQNFVKNSEINESFKGIWGFPLPPEVKSFVEESVNDKDHIHFCFLLRLLIFARYLNDRIAMTIVTAKNENDAFDMFDSLNTTGEPLTAFETFKPKVIEREGLSAYEGTDSHTCIVKIEDYLDRYTKAKQKQSATSDMLIYFALFESGTKLQKPSNYQRRYLHDKYDKLTRLDDIEQNRIFVKSLATMASFLNNLWFVEKDITTNFASLNIDDEEALIGFELLREIKHTITIAPLCRFYQILLEAGNASDVIQKKDDFIAAIKATVAFSVLWRGAKGKTQSIDSHYRDIMRPGINLNNENDIPPLARCPDGKFGTVSITNYKKALQHVLKHKGNIHCREDWVKLASSVPIYQYSRPLTRFLVFCASDGSVPSGNGLLTRGRIGINPFFKMDMWNNNAYFTVEHVAPQSLKTGWNIEIYNDPTTVHTLGNLILLPENANSAIGNKSWKHKKLMYSLLSAETKEDYSLVLEELRKVGLNLSNRADEAIENAGYLGLCKSIALYDEEWSLDIIEKRSRCLAGLAWDRLEEWLFS